MVVERRVSNVPGFETGRAAWRGERNKKLETSHIWKAGIKFKQVCARQCDLRILWYLQLRQVAYDIVYFCLFSGSETIDRNMPYIAEQSRCGPMCQVAVVPVVGFFIQRSSDMLRRGQLMKFGVIIVDTAKTAQSMPGYLANDRFAFGIRL